MIRYSKKILSMLIILTIIIYMFISLGISGWKNVAFAALEQTSTTDINSINSSEYPQIKEMLQKLKEQHPNWNFKILYTNIDWNEAIANEYVGHKNKPRNLISDNINKYDSSWRCKICGDTTYDNGSWYCASEAALGYMMDPRNSANYSDIFQFMQLSYDNCNSQTIKEMAGGTFLDNDYYINTLIEAAKKYNVNAYYLVARIIQEQGKNGSILSAGNGYNGQYVGYYNVFNIGAGGNGKDNVILNGLKRAQTNGWDSVEKSISGGTQIIAEDYISKGQNTLYFQKFDVENSDGELYWHQYMQNIMAAQNEGSTLRKTFEQIGKIDENYTFIIPVYKNMPGTAVVRPSENNTPMTTDLVKLNVSSTIRLRKEPGNSSAKVGTLYRDEIVTRIQKATTKVDGTYWDYVMKSDGTKGYVARETYDYESTYKLYLVPVEQNDNTENIKCDNTNKKIVITPYATVEDIKNALQCDIIIKNQNGEIVTENSKITTGSVVNNEYVIIKKGDANADGLINTFDYIRIMNYIMGNKKMTDDEKLAADANSDGKVDAFDYIRIMNYIMGNKKIEL